MRRWACPKNVSLLLKVLQSVEKNDVWMGDRNFCTVDFLCDIDDKKWDFLSYESMVILPYKLIEPEMRFIGDSQTGKVYEQLIEVVDKKCDKHTYRRITVKLKDETRDGDKEIHILTNLASKEVSAIKIAELYKTRWK